MELGGEGIESRVIDGVLHIKTPSRMVGYNNAPSPFDSAGRHHTGYVDEEDGRYLKIAGRKDDVVNVGGLKLVPADVEKIALGIMGVRFAAATKHENPVMGHCVELLVEVAEDSNRDTISVKRQMREKVPQHMVPQVITMGCVGASPRFKRL